MLTNSDYHNLIQIIDHGFKTNMVTGRDDAKVLLILQAKLETLEVSSRPKDQEVAGGDTNTEEQDGDDVPSSTE